MALVKPSLRRAKIVTGTLNPARLLGLDRKGRLEPGADADLVLWDENLTAARTWVNGHSVYEK